MLASQEKDYRSHDKEREERSRAREAKREREKREKAALQEKGTSILNCTGS